MLYYLAPRYDLGNMMQVVWSTAHGHVLRMSDASGDGHLSAQRSCGSVSRPARALCGGSGRARWCSSLAVAYRRCKRSAAGLLARAKALEGQPIRNRLRSGLPLLRTDTMQCLRLLWRPCGQLRNSVHSLRGLVPRQRSPRAVRSIRITRGEHEGGDWSRRGRTRDLVRASTRRTPRRRVRSSLRESVVSVFNFLVVIPHFAIDGALAVHGALRRHRRHTGRDGARGPH